MTHSSLPYAVLLSILLLAPAQAESEVQTASVDLGGSRQPADVDCACDGKTTCDCATVQKLAAAVAGSHKGLFYNNNFDYLCDPCYANWHLGDNLKRRAVGTNTTIDVGGQYRARLHNERNIRGLGLTGQDDDFLLHRTRLYLNAEIGNRIRFYGELLDADSNYEDFAPRPIEENRAEMQNLFLDVVAWENCCDAQLTARVGRQELAYGSQRLVSPLDWANTRRTFEGAKLIWEGPSWDMDAFWVRPLRRDVDALDPPNLDREFYGIYGNYKGLRNDHLNVYWLALDNHDQDRRFDTLGARYWGNRDAWLYEFEGGYQFGDDPDRTSHDAGFFTVGLGRKFECVPGSPSVWLYYDWASGDANGNGFDHYYPLAHKYLGLMDLYGRRNIEDINILTTIQLSERLQLLGWWHYFSLEDGSDVPYNVNMTPFAGLAPGSSGSQDLGHELDFLLSYKISPRTDLLFGYSHFFAGDYYATTAGVPYNGDADFLYTEFTVNF